MKAGTRNLLFGEHQIIIHPLFVARAWCKLFGFPRDLRLWACFFLHDIGYWGKGDIDGEEGKAHPELGAHLAHWLFDPMITGEAWEFIPKHTWHDFCLYHSRSYARRDGYPVSRLALADKLAFVITPWWVFIPLARLSGGIREYLEIHRAKGWPEGDLREWVRRAKEESWDWLYRTKERPSPIPGYYESWEGADGEAPAVEAPRTGAVAQKGMTYGL